ncbi:aldo/keto reductase [Novosphingobium sp.]|uniref:aldo/keto reductase n=1 Tax=Novosphingobium sp. TaxID=1874826 RepID=UPI00260881A2|nr:aldo/keto reductase [Novosphingobium sp.]
MTLLPQRVIGSACLKVTELGFGSAALGNLYRAMTDATARETAVAARDAGIRYFDTAPHYGRGLSERRLGDALRQGPAPVVSTKAGRLLEPCPVTGEAARDGFVSPMPFRARYDYTQDGILRSHDHSLQRLGLERIDILYLHDIGTLTHGATHATYWEQLTLGGGFKALERLRDSGAIKAFGIGVNEVEVCLQALAEVRLDVILLAGRYTLLEQGALDRLMPRCRDTGTAVVIGGPYNSGILVAGSRAAAEARYDYAPAPPAIIERVRRLEAVAARHGVALPAAALAFVLAHPQVVSVIPGMASVEQVRATLAFYRAPIPADFWAELRAAGLLHPAAPVPGDPT